MARGTRALVVLLAALLLAGTLALALGTDPVLPGAKPAADAPAAPSGGPEASQQAPAAGPTAPAPAPDPAGSQDAGPPRFQLVEAPASGTEMTLGVTSKGTILVGGWEHVARSRDGGATWDTLQFPGGPTDASADRLLLVDHLTDRVFVSDTTLACTTLAWSDDEGDTWLMSPLACGGGMTDHQKIGVGPRTRLADPTGQLYPNAVYVCYNRGAGIGCAVSPDGGITFQPAGPTDTLGFCPFTGMPVADPSGAFHVPASECGPQLLTTTDNGLTWKRRALPFEAGGNSEPSLAVTAEGALHFFHVTPGHLPALARSTDGGATWTDPVEVHAEGLVAATYPMAVGGDAGRLALSFYGTTDRPEGWDGDPATAPDTVRWHGYVAIVTDADAAQPTLRAFRVTPPDDPLEHGCITLDADCVTNIREYTGLDVGPDGRAYALFIDNCPPGCASRAEAETLTPFTYSPAGPLAALVAIQLDGPRLRR